MQNRPVWFARGSARVSRANASPARTFGVAPKQSFSNAEMSGGGSAQEKSAIARRARQHPRRMRYRIALATLFALVHTISHAQEATPTSSPVEAEVESVVVSATRFEIPLDQSPATVSVISSEDIEQRQIQRVSNALREVPGLSVVQTGTAGQLSSVFMRGLPSEDMQVLLDGIPINQGLSGAMNFADITTDDIDRIEVVRGQFSF